jgi:hypothetical protein
MSGDRQHFLPQFLSRGFASKARKKQFYIWVFRRGTAPFEANTLKIGLSNKFYTSGNDYALDDLITQMENKFGYYVDSLRHQTHERELDSAEAPELITHMAFRTKHLRDLFQKPSEYFLNASVDAFSRNDVLEQMVIKEIKSNSEKFVKKLFKGQKLSKRERRRRVDALIGTSPAFAENYLHPMKMVMAKFKEQLSMKLPELIKQGHIKALTKNPLPPKITVDFARQFQWFLVVRENAHMILGDVGVVMKTGTGSDAKLQSLPVENVDQLWLPISDTHVIMGVKDRALISYDFDLLNSETAAISSDFFVSKTNTEREARYASLQATRSTPFTDDLLQEIVSEEFEKFFD